MKAKQPQDGTVALHEKAITPPEWGAPEWSQIAEDEYAEVLFAKLETEEASLQTSTP